MTVRVSAAAIAPRAGLVGEGPEPTSAERGAPRPARRSGPRVLFWLAALPLALGGIVDLPRERAAGPMSALGALTLAEVAVAALVLVACGRYPRRLLERLAPFALFLVWAVASVAWATPDVQGTQNLAAYLLLGFATAASGAVAARDPARAARALDWATGVLDVVGLALVAASVARQGWVLNAEGARWLVHPRSVALTGLAALAWHLARWHEGRRVDLAPAALWAIAIFVSLSRMATITAVVLVAAAGLLHRGTRARGAGAADRRPRLAVAGVGVVALLVAIFAVGPFRARVFRTPAGAVRASSVLTPGSTELQDSDRPLFWAHVAGSAIEAPIVGKGIGSSQAVMNDRWPGVGHPHNDYLRVWHDLGVVGLAALLAALGTWGRALAHDWQRSAEGAAYGENEEGAQALLALAGLLALVGLALPMVTDNAIVYSFVVGPVGVLVGAGLGARAGGGRGRRSGAGSGAAPSGLGGAGRGALANPLDARWTWEPRYPIRRRRRRS